MFEKCKDRSYIAAERELVKRLMISFNEPVVAPSSYSAQRSQAYMATMKDGQEFVVYICLYLTVEETRILYKYAERIKSDQDCRAAEEEGIQFMEAMGFIVDDSNFKSLDIPEQEKLLSTVPLFTSPEEVVAEVAEEKTVEEEVIREVVREAVVPFTEKIESITAEEEPAEVEIAVEEEVRETVVAENVETLKPEALAEVEVQAEREVEIQHETADEKFPPDLFLSKFRMRAAAERMKTLG